MEADRSAIATHTQALAQKDARLVQSAAALTQKERELANKEAALQQARVELADSRARVEELRGHLVQREASLRQEKGELAKTRASVEELRGHLAQREASLRQVNSELADARARVEEVRGQLAQREVSLRQVNSELTNSRRMVGSLQDNVADVSGKLQAGVLDVRKYRGASATDFYDAVLTIPRLEDVYAPESGWHVRVTEKRKFDFAAPREGVRVIPLGHFNTGKTWLIDQLSGAELPKGVAVHTEGISIKEATADKLKILLLDTVGSNSPMDALPQGAKGPVHRASSGVEAPGSASPADALPQGAEGHSASHGAEAVLQELRVQEDFFRQLCFEVGQVILLVVGQMSHKDQTDLVRLARAIRKDRVRKDVVVVHNLRDWDMDMLLQPGKDGMNYVERTQTLFGLADGSLEVTIGTETEMVIRHNGLFKAEDGTREAVVNVYHYYLTDNRLPCSRNRFAIQDMKTIITRSTGGSKSLAEEFATAATKIQGRFASFNMDEPEIVFDPEASRFRIKDPIPQGAYRMKPRDLGSYFTMGSDDPPYSITLVPGTVKAEKGRGRKKAAGDQSRKAYHLQMELPGLCSESLADIKKQIECTDEAAGALRKEQLEGESGMQWTVSFQATLLNVPGELYGQIAEETDSEVQLSRDVALHAVHDEGTRHHFQNGVRTVKVTLRTGITDYDTSEEPIVTYVDGVLGITLIKQSRG